LPQGLPSVRREQMGGASGPPAKQQFARGREYGGCRMKTALVTGVTGQDGSYLTRLLLDKGYRVVATHRRASAPNFWRIDELGVRSHPNLSLSEFELTEPGAAIRLVDAVQPDEVYNLAGQSFVKASFDLPVTTATITGVGPLSVLEAIRIVNPRIRYYQA